MTAGDVALLGVCLGLVTWASWRWAAVAGLPRAVDVLVACGVLVYGTIVGTVLFVGGVLHALSAGPIAAAALVTAALAGATTATRSRRARVLDARRAQWAALRRLGPALLSPLVLVLALATAAAVGYRLAIAVAFPALDWDALAYHLPMADYWLQERRVLTNPFSYWAQIYPGASESAIAWIGALTGTVRAAAGVQIGGALLGAVSVVALCRGAGATRRSSLIGGMLFLLAPLVLTQLSTAEVDVLAAATLLATWHLLLVALNTQRSGSPGRPVARDAPGIPTPPSPSPMSTPPRSQGPLALAVREEEAAAAASAEAQHVPRTGSSVLPTLAVAGIGAGVAVGVKATNLLAIGVLGLMLLATVLWRGLAGRRDRRGAVRRAVVQTAVFSLPALALGSCWYVRNALLWGNPFYPLPLAGLPGNPDVVSLVGADVRQVGTTNPFWAVLVSWASDLEWRSYFYGSPVGGLGAQWVLVLAPAVLVAFVLLARSRHRLYAWGLLAPGVLLLVLYPGQHHSRYTLFLLGLGGVALAVVLDRLPRWPRQGVLAVVTAAAVFSAAAASWQAVDIDPRSFETGPTPPEVFALMQAPATERGGVGLRRAFLDTDRAESGSTIVVPPEFGDFDQPWVLPHALWADDHRRRVVKATDPINDPDQALRALAEHDAQYVVVTKGSRLEAGLLAEPGRMHPAFEVGWLAFAWAAGPGPEN